MVFDLKCKIHPSPIRNDSGVGNRKSENYVKILSVIQMSFYVTQNASEACLKILPFDTIDR